MIEFSKYFFFIQIKLYLIIKVAYTLYYEKIMSLFFAFY